MTTPPAPALPERTTRRLVTGVVLPSAAAALLALVIVGIFSGFLAEPGFLTMGVALAWAFYTAGRALAFWDLPKGLGAATQPLLTGTSLGLVGMSVLMAIFERGPGWPGTPWWVLAAGFGFGLQRAHKPLLKRAREAPDQGRLWGLFERRELTALGALVAGYALAGLGLSRVFAAFAGFIPEAGKALTIGIALYALNGARLLLAFASHDDAKGAGGFVAWFKANLLRNAIVVLVLLAYAVYRDTLARSLPFFPLVEFGLGMAAFGFVVARLRARLKRERTPFATASRAAPHKQRVERITEAEYESVARPIALFIETGRGQRDYVETVRATSGLEESASQRLVARVAAHREPPARPALPLAWSLVSSGAATLFLCAAAAALLVGLLDAPWQIGLYVAVGIVGLATYRLQDPARAHLDPVRAMLFAGAGVGLLFVTFVLFAFEGGDLASVPGIVWIIVVGIALTALGIPAYSAWRLHQRLRDGAAPSHRRELPHVEITNGLRRARKQAGLAAAVAVGLLLVMPPILAYLAKRGVVAQGFTEFYADLMGVAVWLLAAFAGSALARFAGYSRARPRVLAEERRRRDVRLQLHQDVMRTLERV